MNCTKCGGPLDAQGKCPACEAKAKDQAAQDKKVLGKFKDETEALTALQGLERRLSEFGEDNKFLQEELERRDKELAALRTGGTTPATVRSGADDPFAPSEDEQRLLKTEPIKALASFGKRIYQMGVQTQAKILSESNNMKTYEEGLKSAFYGENKDLVGKEIIVGAVTGQVMAENPRVPPHLLLGRIAERTRTELKRMGFAGTTTGSTGAGTRSEGGETRGAQPPEKTPSQSEMEKSIKFQETGKL